MNVKQKEKVEVLTAFWHKYIGPDAPKFVRLTDTEALEIEHDESDLYGRYAPVNIDAEMPATGEATVPVVELAQAENPTEAASVYDLALAKDAKGLEYPGDEPPEEVMALIKKLIELVTHITKAIAPRK